MPIIRKEGDLLGRVIRGNLELVERLGAGSMGQVYRAHHHNLDKPVAIKVMLAEPRPTRKQIGRFKTEAQATSRLDHPNTVRILDFGSDGDDGLLFIAMEYLDGEELTKLLSREGRLHERRAARIMMQILAALAAAHDQGIVHRDIKPGNIMLVTATGDDGAIPEFVKVCDFGIAKLVAGGGDIEPLTIEGMTVGTPAYSSPEQIMGQSLDGRSDIYSCGIMLYLMLTGQRPFDGEAMEVAMRQVSSAPPPLAALRPDVSQAMIAVVEKAMAKDPAHRFTNAREMRSALKPVMGLVPNATTGSYLTSPIPQSAPPAPVPAPTPHGAPPPPAFGGPAVPPSFGGPAMPGGLPPPAVQAGHPPPAIPPAPTPPPSSNVPPPPAPSAVAAPPPPLSSPTPMPANPVASGPTVPSFPPSAAMQAARRRPSSGGAPPPPSAMPRRVPTRAAPPAPTAPPPPTAARSAIASYVEDLKTPPQGAPIVPPPGVRSVPPPGVGSVPPPGVGSVPPPGMGSMPPPAVGMAPPPPPSAPAPKVATDAIREFLADDE